MQDGFSPSVYGFSHFNPLCMLGWHQTNYQSKNGCAPGTAGHPLPLRPYLRADSWTNTPGLFSLRECMCVTFTANYDLLQSGSNVVICQRLHKYFFFNMSNYVVSVFTVQLCSSSWKAEEKWFSKYPAETAWRCTIAFPCSIPVTTLMC